jgi:hypothetical protein
MRQSITAESVAPAVELDSVVSEVAAFRRQFEDGRADAAGVA